VTAEIKRMYVVPAQQRRGIARRMLAHLESTAASAGIEGLVLETGLEQPEAIALYTACGYEPVPGFGYYCGSELSRTFGRRLAPSSLR
jgi:GNAT superfamily N-acetyltransferase